MATTEKRITLALTKEDLRILEKLSEKYKETKTQVIKRAMIILHQLEFIKTEDNGI